jgi:hypothetical protein
MVEYAPTAPVNVFYVASVSAARRIPYSLGLNQHADG